MLKTEQLEASGFKAALRGMRNPLNSWNKQDSYERVIYDGNLQTNEFVVGDNDLKLCQKLINAGPEHAKFLRMINVSLDIIAPLYWWKELDTYKIGTVANSCSTMHKITAKEFTLEDFSCEHLLDETLTFNIVPIAIFRSLIDCLNENRRLYLETKDKKYWWQLIQLLPSSYNQKRTLTLNYAVVRNIISQRQNHKLDEWHQLIDSFKKLPYAKELLFYKNMEVDDNDFIAASR